MKMMANKCVKREKFTHEDYITGDYILFLVEEGEFSISDGKESAILTKNNATIIKPGVRYHREIISPAILHVFRFKTNYDLSSVPLKMVFEDESRVESSIKLLKKLYSYIYPNDFDLRQSLLLDIINQHLIESNFFHNSSPKYDKIIYNAVATIEKNIKGKIKLSEIASESGISYVQFARRFKKYIGLSPVEYILEARMKLARELLADDDILIKYIASECGFDNEYYFSNAFKKHNGISPSEYRKSLI